MIGLRTGGSRTRPLESEDEFAFSVAGGVEAPAEARHEVAARLRGILDDGVLDTLQLLVSELATNCVQHAAAGAGKRIDVAVSLPPGAVRVELSTAAPAFQAPPAKPPRPGPAQNHGRGLFIVDALSRVWGVEPDAFNRVWFELATTQAG